MDLRYTYFSWIFLGIFFILNGCQPTVPDATRDQERNVSLTSSSKQPLSDEAYIAYRNSHDNSPEIPKMILAMIHTHIKAKEYRLARFYCDEYRRDYPSGKQRRDVEFLRVKSLFLLWKEEGDDALAQQLEEEIKQFRSLYAQGVYRIRIKALQQEMRLRQKRRYKKLAAYYQKRGKPEAAAFYREKIESMKKGE